MMSRIRMMTPGERVGKALIALFLLASALIALYPFAYTFAMSISAPEHVLLRDVYFFPKGIGLEGYRLVFANATIWQSYGNTIFYTVVGTAINMVVTVLIAYVLARPQFVLRKQLSLMITITMFFSGGMIPFFITITNLGLYNTRWGVLLPFAASAWNIIIARSFYEKMPESLIESAKIDGANDLVVLLRVVLPLSGPILSVLMLYYAVGHWNSYFWPLVLLNNQKLQPLQIYLYKILVQLKQDVMGGVQISISRSIATEQYKYASIIISILPILIVYPLVQKHFAKGMMIGAVKE